MNIMITGASRGLGFATAFRLATETGHEVTAISRNQKKLGELKAQCLKKNAQSRLQVLAMDLEEVLYEPGKVYEKISLATREINILIHNAGKLVNRAFEETTYEEGLGMFRTNFFVPARLTAVLLPLLKDAHVLSIGSMGGFQGSAKFPGLSYYSASKGALATWTECMAEEFREKNIRFNALAIGSVQTEMLDRAFPGYKAPLKAEEMAAFVAGFALNGHKYFNGKILPVALTTP